MNLVDNIRVSVKTLKDSNLGGLMASNSLIKMSPTFMTTFRYYLKSVLLFTTFEFSLKSLSAELFLLIGIILLNSVLKNSDRPSFLKLSGFLYMLSNLLLIPILFVLSIHPEISPLAPILVYTGLHSLFYEIFSLPIVGIFLEICPEGLEGFFMSLVFFINNFSRNVGNFLGALCIYMLRINSRELSDLNLLIVVHSSVTFLGLVMLMFSHIPGRTVVAKGGEVEIVEKMHLAYIKTVDEIMVDELHTLREFYSCKSVEMPPNREEENELVTSAENIIIGDFQHNDKR
jgi:hypothetical protein